MRGRQLALQTGQLIFGLCEVLLRLTHVIGGCFLFFPVQILQLLDQAGRLLGQGGLGLGMYVVVLNAIEPTAQQVGCKGWVLTRYAWLALRARLSPLAPAVLLPALAFSPSPSILDVFQRQAVEGRIARIAV